MLSYKRELLPDYSGYNINIILNEGNPFVINNILIQNELSQSSKVDLLNQVFLKAGDKFDERALERVKKLNNFLKKMALLLLELNMKF